MPSSPGNRQEPVSIEVSGPAVSIVLTQGAINIWFGKKFDKSIIAKILLIISKVDGTAEHEKEVLCPFEKISEFENNGYILTSYARKKEKYRAIFVVPFSNSRALEMFMESISQETEKEDVKIDHRVLEMQPGQDIREDAGDGEDDHDPGGGAGRIDEAFLEFIECQLPGNQETVEKPIDGRGNSRLIAVAEHSPPLAVTMAREKKCLSSKTPSGVAMNLLLVTRETVDSCTPTSSAISRRPSGFMASGPYSRKWRWCLTMARATLKMVAKRCSTLLTVQRASSRWAASSACWALRLRWNISA